MPISPKVLRFEFARCVGLAGRRGGVANVHIVLVGSNARLSISNAIDVLVATSAFLNVFGVASAFPNSIVVVASAFPNVLVFGVSILFALLEIEIRQEVLRQVRLICVGVGDIDGERVAFATSLASLSSLLSRR